MRLFAGLGASVRSRVSMAIIGAAAVLSVAVLGTSRLAAQSVPPDGTPVVPSVKILKGQSISPTTAAEKYGAYTQSTDGLCRDYGVVVAVGTPDRMVRQSTKDAICSDGAHHPRAPEIKELARALRYDPNLIYEYVRNSVDTEFLFGAHKGPLGVIIDHTGTAFDQAELLVELLRESSGKIAAGTSTAQTITNVQFQYGTITLTGDQFYAWTGIRDAKAVCDFLATGGIPAIVDGATDGACPSSGSNAASITMAHVWVTASFSGGGPLGSGTFVFDAAYKPYEHKTGIDYRGANAMQFPAGEPLALATGNVASGTQSGVDYVASFSDQALGDALGHYATKLLARLKQADMQGAAMDDVVGGREILPAERPAGGWKQTDIAFTHSTPASWDGVPDQYRAVLTITATRTVNSAPVSVFAATSFFADEIYGRRLQIYPREEAQPITGNPPSQPFAYYPILALDGVGLKEGAVFAESAVTRLDLTIKADHPFAARAVAGGDFNTFGDSSAVKSVNFVLPVTIVHAWGQTSENLGHQWEHEQGRDSPLVQTQICNGAPECDLSTPLLSGDLMRARLGGMWLSQFSRAAELHAEIGGARVLLHHTIGVISGDFSPVYTASRAMVTDQMDGVGQALTTSTAGYNIQDETSVVDVESSYGVISRASDAANRRAAIHAIALTGATLEGSVLEQLNGTPDAASTANRFAWDNTPEAGETPNISARKFVGLDASSAVKANDLVVAENLSTGVQPDIFGTQLPLSAPYVDMFKARLAGAMSGYAAAGFDVTASVEAMSGPGYRNGTEYLVSSTAITKDLSRYWPGRSMLGVSCTLYLGVTQAPNADGSGGSTSSKLECWDPNHYNPPLQFSVRNFTLNTWERLPSLQVGGALIANRYDANGDPVEIAHVITRFTDIAKGGGAPSITQAKVYDPAGAADAMKDRFIDRSSALGVNLAAGRAGWTGPVLKSIGQGAFPYKLETRLELRGDGLSTPNPRNDNSTYPTDEDGIVSNWDGGVQFSGSAHEAMGSSRVEASAATIAAFVAMQDTYKADRSKAREVVGALIGAWWDRMALFNVATVTQGGSSEQHIRLFDDTWLPAAGGAARLTVTGSRYKVRPNLFGLLGQGRHQTEAALRVWKQDQLHVTLKGASGDVREYEYWTQGIDQPTTTESKFTGFRLKRWRFPQGVDLTLSYEGSQAAVPTRVTSSEGFSLAIVQAPELACGGDTTLTAQDAAGATIKVAFKGMATRTPTQRPEGSCAVQAVHTPYFAAASGPQPTEATVPAVQYAYDTTGHIMEARDAVALLTPAVRGPHQFFLAPGYRSERQDPLGGRYAVEVMKDGRLVKSYNELFFAGQQQQLVTALRDGRGRVVQRTYPEGDQSKFKYDDRDNPIELRKVAKPCGSGCAPAELVITAAWHTEYNKPIWIKDALGRQTDFDYYGGPIFGLFGGNGEGLVKTATRPAPKPNDPRPTYSYEYDGRGHLTRSVDPTGIETVSTYDVSTGFLLTTRIGPSSLGIVSSYRNDAAGNILDAWDGRGESVSKISTVYDAMRRPTQIIAPLGGGTKTTYDAAGRPVKVEKRLLVGGTETWQTWLTAYTPTGKPWWVADPLGNVALTEYDALDRTTKITSPRGDVTTFDYDPMSELTKETRGFGSADAGTFAEFGYTPNGQKAFVKDGRGNTTTYSYDGFDRPDKTIYPDATYEQNVTYDLAGNILKGRTREGNFIVFTYDNLDRKLTESGFASDGLTPGYQNEWWRMRPATFAYDAAGRMLSAATDQIARSWTYDLAGRPATHVRTGYGNFSSSFGSFSYSYDAANNVTSEVLPSGVSLGYVYDGLNRVTRATLGAGGWAEIDYDTLGRRTAIRFGDGSRQDYGYDAADRLLTLAHSFPNASADNVTYTYAYDQNGRQVSETTSNTAYEYSAGSSGTTYGAANAINVYPSVGGQAITYSADGAISQDTAWRFFYDEKRQLKAIFPISDSNYGRSLYVDALGERFWSFRNFAGQPSTALVQLSDGIRSEIAVERTDTQPLGTGSWTQGAWTSYALVGIDERLITLGPDGAYRYPHTNKLGSTIAVAKLGAAEAKYNYGPFGTSADSTGGYPWRYTGQRLDDWTGLYNYKAREYSPNLGRFLQPDPAGFIDGPNIYSYVVNDPYNSRDPTGTQDAFGEGMAWGKLIEYTCEGQESGCYEREAWKIVLGAPAAFGSGVACAFGGCEAAGAWAVVTSRQLMVSHPRTAWLIIDLAAAEVGISTNNKAAIVDQLAERAVQLVGWKGIGTKLIIDESLGANPTAVAAKLREMGYDAKSVPEIFEGARGVKDPIIKFLAKLSGARVVTSDRGHDAGGGFGDLAVSVPQRLRDPDSVARLVASQVSPR
jgi:RHS repeat-associated protein